MAKHIGIVACSAEGAALCYRTICSEGPALMGEHMHPEVTMHTFPLGDYMTHIYKDDWNAIARLMIESAKKVARLGADFLICPDNTIHQVFDEVAAESPVEWLHIATCVGEQSRDKGYKTLAILGTKYLMTGPVYRTALEALDIECQIPKAGDREKIDRIIFGDLVYGRFPEEHRLYLNDVMAGLKETGCDAAVLGCTEIPLIVDPNDCPLPTLDSTRLLARAALAKALQ